LLSTPNYLLNVLCNACKNSLNVIEQTNLYFNFGQYYLQHMNDITIAYCNI